MVKEYSKLTNRTFLQTCKFLQQLVGKQNKGDALELFFYYVVFRARKNYTYGYLNTITIM